MKRYGRCCYTHTQIPKTPVEKGMATHSSILAWRIPGTEEPGGLQSMGSQRVRHKEWNWTTFAHSHSLRDQGMHCTQRLPLSGAVVPNVGGRSIRSLPFTFSFTSWCQSALFVSWKHGLELSAENSLKAVSLHRSQLWCDIQLWILDFSILPKKSLEMTANFSSLLWSNK